MAFILYDKDNETYLGETKNAFVPKTKKENAIIFNTSKDATNALHNRVPQILKRNYNWELFSVIGNNETQNDEVDSRINSSYTPIDIDELKGCINELSDKFTLLKGNKEWLLDQESDIDKQISDILHFVEFNSFNACDGFKLCKALKEFRIKRREVKNELELINIINTQTCNGIANGNTNKCIDNLQNKQYSPRVLTELFQSRNVDVLSVNRN